LRSKPLSRIAGEGDRRLGLRSGEGLSLSQRFQDGENDPFGIGQNIIIPEAKDHPAVAFQNGIATRIGLALDMLATVRLNSDLIFRAGEIEDEAADRMLSAKSITG